MSKTLIGNPVIHLNVWHHHIGVLSDSSVQASLNETEGIVQWSLRHLVSVGKDSSSYWWQSHSSFWSLTSLNDVSFAPDSCWLASTTARTLPLQIEKENFIGGTRLFWIANMSQDSCSAWRRKQLVSMRIILWLVCPNNYICSLLQIKLE